MVSMGFSLDAAQQRPLEQWGLRVFTNQCRGPPNVRKHSVSKSLRHLFQPTSKFVKNLKRDDCVLVTAEEQLPIVEVDDSYSSLTQDFLWFTKWCRTRLSWSDSEWQRVIFSDESRFSLGGDAQRIRVWRHRGQHRDERSVVTRPEDLVSLHLHPYRTICRNCVRMFKLHGMDYHRTPSGTSTAPYRDVWRVGLANTAAHRHTERQTSTLSVRAGPSPQNRSGVTLCGGVP
ncbi:hypothetical protein NFI96_004219 [Prochilodus magdalenae]|nr:hypothetical protein NFI96_004219 [Prochilodus magdalenae]